MKIEKDIAYNLEAMENNSLFMDTEYVGEESFFDSQSYNFKLDSFEGPLDLLLELIKKSKLSIHEIKISEITEQYMEHMQDIGAADLERASDFIAMAAWLLEIKSKALLPKPEEEDPEEEDSAKLLIQKLEEYKLYKEASIKMREIETVDILFRNPDATFIEKPRFALKDMNKESLMDALRRMFMKLEKRAASIVERQIEMDKFTVDDKMQHIVSALEILDNFSFSQLFDADYTKSEIITTFQALLELMKMERLRIVQEDIFGDIIIHRVQIINE